MEVISRDPAIVQLESWIERIWDKAGEFGLHPFTTHFEVVPATIMYEFGSYGLPGRFSHWTHGRAYHQMKTMYDYGLSKIYELVINTDPCYAFLMEANTPLENKLVVAHVLAHCDFFRHNALFARTNRQMVETASVNAERIHRYEYEHGTREVERFLDAVLSIEDHVDPLEVPSKQRDHQEEQKKPRPRTTAFDDMFDLDGRGKQTETAALSRLSALGKAKKFPEEPQRDLLAFLIEHAPDLEDWQRDVIATVRQERLYFAPQMRTKVLNEGWASYWHCRILRELDLPTDEYTEFARLHSSVAAPSPRSLNPYYLGMKLLEHVEQRWENPSQEDRERMGLPGGQGKEKLFEIRELESDLSFIRNYLTKDAVEELDLYTYEYDNGIWKITEKNWEKVRNQIVRSLETYGIPYIMVEDADYKRSRELYLKHYYDGDELDVKYAEKTLQYVYQLWGRSVHLETVVDGKPVVFTYDGTKHAKAAL
jgi:stage V sporulation protein R